MEYGNKKMRDEEKMNEKIQDEKAQVDMWVQEVLEWRIRDCTRVLDDCTEILKYAGQKDDRKLLGFAYFYMAEAHYVLNEIDEMLETLAKAVGYLDETDQWELLARAYNLMAITSINKGNAPVAMDYYLAGLKCCKEHNIPNIVCSIIINLGYLYMQNGVYSEAQHYFDEAYALYSHELPGEKNIGRQIMIFTNLASCYLLSGDMGRAKEYMDKIHEECEPHFTDMDYVYVGCLKARYYHATGEYELRDVCIDDIHKRIDSEMPMLDLFDDLYELCSLCLEIGEYDVMWSVMERLEPITLQSKIANLEKKLLSLKILYYKKCGQEQEYLNATARFYELVMAMESENKKMITNMLYIRTSLEQARESKKKVEEINVLLTEKSETDPLTGLGNRYRLTEHSQKILDECAEKHKLFAIEILDIDYFKEYNDNYGHQAGDECIRAVAGLIRDMQDDNIFCARYGGDEFIIVYNGLDRRTVNEKAEKLRMDVMGLKIEHKYSRACPVVTISQGICYGMPIQGKKSWDFLHVADKCLYDVKRKRRNDICMGEFL